jgi:hypothetical protein
MTGVPGVHSDGNGKFQADLPITLAWSVGVHKLMAKDGGGYLATNVGSVRIVNRGETNTPGPHGAPPDNSTFTLKITMKQDNSSAAPFTKMLTVMGQRSSDSATACDELYDHDQQWTSNGTVQGGGGLTYTETDRYSCKGSYKGGKLSYTEMLDSSKANYSDGSSCQAASSVVNMQVDGLFSSATILKGTYSEPSYSVSCTAGQAHNTGNTTASTGTWTGTVS